MTNTIATPEFKRALLDSVLSEYVTVPNEEDIFVDFSDKFLSSLSSAKRLAERNVVHITKGFLRRALIAAVIACTLVSGSIAMPYEKPEQAGVVLHRDGAHYSYSTVVEDPSALPERITPCAPGYIPGDFESTLSLVDSGIVLIDYCRSDGAYIRYAQRLILADPAERFGSDSYGHSLYAVNASAYTAHIDDLLVHVIKDEDMYDTVVIWASDSSVFYMHFSPEVTWAEIEHIVGSVRPSDDFA